VAPRQTPTSRRWPTKQDLVILAIAGILLGSTFTVLQAGPTTLVVSMFGVAALGAVCLSFAQRIAPALLTARISLGILLLQVASIAVVIGFTDPLRMMGAQSVACDDPRSVALLFLTCLLSISAALPVLGLLAIPEKQSMLARIAVADPRRYRAHVLLGLAGIAAMWIGSLPGISKWVGYSLRVFSTSLVLIPLIAGLVLPKKGWWPRIWVAAMTLNLALGFLAGGRLPALRPIIFFSIGRIVRSTGAERKKMLVGLSLLGLPILATAAIIGEVRGVVGRGGLEVITENRVSDVIQESKSVLERAGANDVIQTQGLSRLVAWANPAVAAMTPHVIPYRGFDSLVSDITDSLDIAALSGKSSRDLLDRGLGNAPATLYGFTVNASTSVEFGIPADGWSRGGVWGAAFFCFIQTLALGILELLSLRAMRSDVGIFLFSIVAQLSLDMCSMPLPTLLRNAILYGLFAACLGGISILISRLFISDDAPGAFRHAPTTR
jgi:hypothetical protein